MLNESVESVNHQCRNQIRSFISLIYEQQPQDESLKAKQEFLKNEIYDYYNQDENILNLFYQYFVDYTFNYKIASLEEPDLTIYTIEELTKLIANFKYNLKNIRQQKEIPDSQNKLQKSSSTISRDDASSTKIFYKNGAWDHELILPTMSCNQEKHFFNGNTSVVAITFLRHFFKKSPGFFGIGGEMVLWIDIETAFMGKKIRVSRNFDDFLFLEKTLHSIFPYSFIPPLRISKDDLKSTTQSSIKKIISNCFAFLSKVSKREELLENVFTFRFLVQQKPRNYRQHKLNNENIIVDGFKTFKTITGKVSVDVSDKAEMMKMDIIGKSGYFEKIWSNIGDLMNCAVNSCNELSQYLSNISDQFKIMKKIILFPEGAESLRQQISPSLKHISKLISTFQEIITFYRQSIKQSNNTILHLKTGFVDRAQLNWEQFNNYKTVIQATSAKYQQRRKVFLEKQTKNLQESLSKSPKQNKSDLNIKNLNLKGNPQEEEWFVTQTPWYGYLNHEFLATFDGFVERDCNRLEEGLKEVSQEIYKRNHESQKQISGGYRNVLVND